MDADVEFVAVDPAGKYVYYLSSEISPVEKQLFRVEVKSGKKNRLTTEEGWHNITMSGDCAYFVDNYSSIKVPRNVDLTMNTGKVVRRLQEVENPNKDYNFGEITLGKIKADDGSDLYYRLIKPMDFDPNQEISRDSLRVWWASFTVGNQYVECFLADVGNVYGSTWLRGIRDR